MEMGLSSIIGWFLNNPPKSKEDLNTRLTREATEAEKKVAVLEEEVKIRARLVTANTRIKKAKQQMSVEQARRFVWITLGVVVVGMLVLMLKDCGGA